MSAIITIRFVVPAGYADGDYAMLHSNGGAGSIDWDNPVSAAEYELFPEGSGLFGWGHAPWGHFRWGHGHSMRTAGWGHLPWGHFPWGHGTAVIYIKHRVEACGLYKFGLACYDKFGNKHSGSPEEVELDIHIAPAKPTGLAKYSYDKATDTLILDVA